MRPAREVRLKQQLRQRHDVRQSQILQAVGKLITTKGMDSVTMHDIAAEVGVSEAAIYRHVDSKQQILRLVLEDIERGLLELVEQGRKDGTSSLEKLKNILKAHLSYAERRRGLSFLVIDEVLKVDDRKLRKFAGRVVEKYLNAIQGV